MIRYLFIAVFIAALFLMWTLMHRVLDANDNLSSKIPTKRSDVKTQKTQHIQDLVDQTQMLLKELQRANVTLSAQAQEEVQRLREDKHLTQRDMKELLRDLQHAEDGFSRCISEKYQVRTELESCLMTPAAPVVNEPHEHTVAPLPAVTTIIPQPPTTTTHKWLVIGIPTVARLHEEEYLLQSLEVLAAQLPAEPSDLLYGRVLVSVLNVQLNTANHAQPHRVFERARALYAAPHPKAAYFEFADVLPSEILPDPVAGATAKSDPGNANKPGFLVRRQTRNIVSVIRRNAAKARYYLFLEDDMQLCANGLLAVQYLLAKADRYHPNWLAIRASYGMNGIFMHSADLSTFADYLVKHQARRPPDHLVVEWYAGETPEAKAYRGKRANLGFKHNLFDHIGAVSTLRSQRSGAFPRCYELLAEPTVFQVEAFSPLQCPRDDLWPCNVPHAEHVVSWDKQHPTKH